MGLDVLLAWWGHTEFLVSSEDFGEQNPGTSEIVSALVLSSEIKGIPCFPVAICQRISLIQHLQSGKHRFLGPCLTKKSFALVFLEHFL